MSAASKKEPRAATKHRLELNSDTETPKKKKAKSASKSKTTSEVEASAAAKNRGGDNENKTKKPTPSATVAELLLKSLSQLEGYCTQQDLPTQAHLMMLSQQLQPYKSKQQHQPRTQPPSLQPPTNMQPGAFLVHLYANLLLYESLQSLQAEQILHLLFHSIQQYQQQHFAHSAAEQE